MYQYRAYKQSFRAISNGQAPGSMSADTMWRRIQSRGDFFRTLPPMESMPRLWKFLQGLADPEESTDNGQKQQQQQQQQKLDGKGGSIRVRTGLRVAPPFILTGLPGGKFGKSAKKHKQKWCRAQLKIKTPARVICCLTREKGEYSGPGKILIDDNEGASVVGEGVAGETGKGVFSRNS
eukprot:jgi/Bigna1/147247/aug1.135_g21955